jgi:HD-GYP domain-containing protein (c-di-GMP phosphodiesterase class II)
MAESVPSTETHQAAFLENVATALSSAFGASFRFWALEDPRDRWTPIAVGSESARPTETPLRTLEKEMEDRLQGAMDAIEPILLEKGNGQVLLGLPLGQAEGRRLAATATLRDSPVPWTLKLARLCLNDVRLQEELHRCHDDLAVCAAQIGNDFEELSFLRTLADHLDVSELACGPWHVAEMVLPMLAEIIRAESLVLVTSTRGAGDAARALIDQPVVWIGRRGMSDEVCKEFVSRFREPAKGQPLVRNHFSETPEGRGFPGVHKFVMTTLVKRDRVLGWLLAINHVRRPHDQPENTLWRLSDFEFGTVEAGLLSSVASMLATHACNVEMVREKEGLLVNVVRAMVSAVDAKDPYTCGHSERVALASRLVAREMGISEADCEHVYLAGLLHDLGKLSVPDAVLRKTGKLTDDEFQLIRPHPEKGWAILQELRELSYLFPGVLHHHERYDGKGYPDGLVGEETPLVARILAIADAYDAMTSDRPYRTGMPAERVETIVREGSGTQWDPKVIEAFLRALPEIKALWANYRQPAPRQRNGAAPGGQVSAAGGHPAAISYPPSAISVPASTP